jgi:hypothetical protein
MSETPERVHDNFLQKERTLVSQIADHCPPDFLVTYINEHLTALADERPRFNEEIEALRSDFNFMYDQEKLVGKTVEITFDKAFVSGNTEKIISPFLERIRKSDPSFFKEEYVEHKEYTDEHGDPQLTAYYSPNPRVDSLDDMRKFIKSLTKADVAQMHDGYRLLRQKVKEHAPLDDFIGLIPYFTYPEVRFVLRQLGKWHEVCPKEERL